MTQIQRERLERGASFESPVTGARLEVIAISNDEEKPLTIKRRIPPRGRTVPPRTLGGMPHSHDGFTERFKILEGVAEARRTRGLGVGDRISLRVGEVFFAAVDEMHVNPYNTSSDWLVFKQTFNPGTESVRAFILTLGDALEQGRDSVDGYLPVLPTAAVFDETRAGTFLPVIPIRAQRHVLLPLAAKLAARRKWPITLSR
jgi:hypothetical protein